MTTEATQEAITLWNEHASRAGWPLVSIVNSKRVTAINARLEECGGLDGWKEALAHAEQSDFLCGKTPRSEAHASWRFNIDSFIRPSMFARCYEGAFSNRPKERPSTGLMAVLGALADD